MKTILFNPFKRFQANDLLLIGIAATILGFILAGIFNTHYDGIVDVHFGMNINFWHPLLENIINIAILTLFLYLIGIYLNRKTRLIDIFTTCMVARTPLYILPLFNINHFMGHIGNQLINNISHQAQILQLYAVVPLIVISIIMILAIIWYIVLLYNGFKVDSHARGTLANILFTIAIILAEVASKYIITVI